MGILSRLFRRMGYVRLRDYNLRPTADGNLAVIDSRRPLPIDFGRPAIQPRDAEHLNQWPEIPHLAGPPPIPRRQLAEGTADGLEPVTRREVEGNTKPLNVIRGRSKSDTIPDAIPDAISGAIPKSWDD